MTNDQGPLALDVLPPVRHSPPFGGGCQRKTGKDGGRRTMGDGRRWGGLVLVLGLATAGCCQRDKECLARVGRKLVGKAEEAGTNVPGSLGNGLQTVRASAEHG